MKEMFKDMSDFELGALFKERIEEQWGPSGIGGRINMRDFVTIWKTYFDNAKLDQRTELIDFLRNNPPQRRNNG